MARLTIVFGAAVLFTSLVANSFSLAIPDQDAEVSSDVVQSSPGPKTSKDEASSLNFSIDLVTSTESSQTPSVATKENVQTALVIDEMIKKVENRSTRVFRKLIDLGSQDVKAKSELTTSYREKLGTYVQTLKSYVDGIIAAEKNEHIHKYECQKFFDDFAMTLVDNTLEKIHEVFSEAHHDMSINFGQFSIQTKQTIDRLMDLKNKTLTGTDEIVNSGREATAIYESYKSGADDFYRDFMIQADGPGIMEKIGPILDRNVNSGLDVIEKTYSCVLSVR